MLGDLIFPGRDTTACLLSWMVYELTRRFLRLRPLGGSGRPQSLHLTPSSSLGCWLSIERDRTPGGWRLGRAWSFSQSERPNKTDSKRWSSLGLVWWIFQRPKAAGRTLTVRRADASLGIQRSRRNCMRTCWRRWASVSSMFFVCFIIFGVNILLYPGAPRSRLNLVDLKERSKT